MDDRIRVEQKPATAARIYDVYLGGTHNFPADRAAAEAVIRTAPRTPRIARANRAFLRRAVRYLAGAGVTQFLDIGSGIPTEGNVHEIAQAIVPDAHVVYVDIDPVAVAESLEILDGNPTATALRGDFLDGTALLHRPEVTGLLDLTAPVAVLLGGMLHFVPDDAAMNRALSGLREAIVPGSYLVISHAANDHHALVPRPRRGDNDDERAVQEIYTRQTTTPFRLRSRAEVAACFGDADLVEPGLVWLPQWRPDPVDPSEFADEPHLSSGWCGVGRLR